ncbi:MAG TPA: DUF4013 domain-containing protein [Methanoregula sp.]|nr:DUF4013 domain-containing protein [Methanoregula sp.]
MDYGEITRDAFSFMKEGVFANTGRWLRLILAAIIIGIPLNGYAMRIYRGPPAAPEVDRWGNLFIDGLKLLVVGLIYAIPIILLSLVIYWPVYGGLMRMMQGDPSAKAALANWAPNPGLLALLYIVEIIIAIIVPIAQIRFARSGSFAEAFNFGAILETIGSIGWLRYILALIFIALIIGIPVGILFIAFIVLAGIAIAVSRFSIGVILGCIAVAVIVGLLLIPLITVFQARYMTRVYDSASPPVPAAQASPASPVAV